MLYAWSWLKRSHRVTRRAPPARGWRRSIECLESRLALDGAEEFLSSADAHGTLSFAPDGTQIAGQSSALFSTMRSLGSDGQWQEAILRAFQTWAVHTNADLGVLDDAGQPFGTSGPTRNDERFGDVRIGAAALSSGVFAVSVPSTNVVAGTWVGDVIFNSDASLDDLDDLFAVALHEAGNVFGLRDSDDPLSPMFSPGIPSVTDPTPQDLAALTAIYGERAVDLNEADDEDDPIGNDSFQLATELKIPEWNEMDDGSAPSIVYGDIRDGQDLDYFFVEAPSGYSGPVTATVHSREISLLAPELSVHDEMEQLLGQTASAAQSGDVLSFQIQDVNGGEKLFFRIAGARPDLFGIGGYSLVVTFDSRLQVSQELIETIAGGAFRFLSQDDLDDFFEDDEEDNPFFNDDLHADDNALGAQSLKTAPGFMEQTRYEAVGSLADATDVDYYTLKSATPTVGMQNVMTISIRSLDPGQLVPQASVLDHDANLLVSEILVNGHGQYVVQVRDVEPDATHYVRIESAGGGGLFETGNYQMVVSFGQDAVDMDLFATGILEMDEPHQVQALYVASTQLFHVALDVGSAVAEGPVGVMATILDAQFTEVYRIAARPGETRTSTSVLLTPGTYAVRISAAALGGTPIPQLAYTFRGLAVSDPLAIDPDDPTSDPVFECPDNSAEYCYPGDIRSPDPHLWDLFLFDIFDSPAVAQFLGAVHAQPDLDPAELIARLLGDWWFWVWDSRDANGPPLAFNDAYTVPQATPLQVLPAAGVLVNDLDPESDPLVAIVVDNIPKNAGDLLLNFDGSLTYTPRDSDFFGQVTFTYFAFDFVHESNVTTVSIFVQPSGGAQVVGRHIFYNNSVYDGWTAGPDSRDDAAIAPDKRALLRGATASLANYTSYSRGMNGLMVDIQGLADPEGLSAADFTFRVGNDNTPAGWSPGPLPWSLTVRPGQGLVGSDRVSLIWEDKAIEKEWLEVTVRSSSATGLLSDDVFYMGNAAGETGNLETNAVVDTADIEAVRIHQTGPFFPAGITDPYDLNRDRLVNATDIIIARDNSTDPLTALPLVSLPAPPPSAPSQMSSSTLPITAFPEARVTLDQHDTRKERKQYEHNIEPRAAEARRSDAADSHLPAGRRNSGGRKALEDPDADQGTDEFHRVFRLSAWIKVARQWRTSIWL